MQLNTIDEIVNDIRQGKMVILLDDEGRENEGDLIIAAERVRTEDINFMATYARGLICLTLTRERCEFLKLPLMVNENHTPFNTSFTVSIEAASGVTTGISAADRARTIQTAVARDTKAEDIVQPGHIFPIMAQPGGVLRRAGHTEAGCDLARMAGYLPAAVIVEIMNEDGSMARRADLEKFAQKHKLKIGTIVDLIHYRIANEQTVKKTETTTMQTRYGEFQVHKYKDSISGNLHLAFSKGTFKKTDPILVRVHIPNTLRDICEVFTERTSWSFSSALEKINEEGKGVAVLLSGNDYGQDLEQNIAAAQMVADSYRTDLTIGTGSQILRDLGVGKMRLLGYPARFNAISGFDLEVVDFVPFSD
ncbi:MAG: bifunctional 3,4-dihydroxy-2-butanone-4-phosphate synthase/GTP cyclohydrolase II [Pseudohongiellaceae bacterium]